MKRAVSSAERRRTLAAELRRIEVIARGLARLRARWERADHRRVAVAKEIAALTADRRPVPRRLWKAFDDAEASARDAAADHAALCCKWRMDSMPDRSTIH